MILHTTQTRRCNDVNVYAQVGLLQHGLRRAEWTLLGAAALAEEAAEAAWREAEEPTRVDALRAGVGRCPPAPPSPRGS